jgi:Flp pilus assembly protein TadG
MAAFFLRDRRGTVAIQVALILPILIIIVMGTFELWKILYVKSVLNDAAYQGVRVLALRPHHPNIKEEAKALVRRSAARSPFIGDDAYSGTFAIVTTVDGGGRCFANAPDEEDKPGSVVVSLAYPWTVGKEFGGGRFQGFLDFLNFQGLVLRVTARGSVVCDWKAP